MENKFLAIIAIILGLVLIIGANYAYGEYKMSEMDKYMKQANEYIYKADNLSDEANSLVKQNDYDGTIAKIDDALWNYNQALNLTQKAYQSADGSYKEFLALSMKAQNVNIDMYSSWKTRVQYIQDNELYKASELKNQEDDRLNDFNRYVDELESIKAQNPEIQEHIDNNW